MYHKFFTNADLSESVWKRKGGKEQGRTWKEKGVGVGGRKEDGRAKEEGGIRKGIGGRSNEGIANSEEGEAILEKEEQSCTK